MEPWRETWRGGIAPQLPAEGLRALAAALAADDPTLIQGASSSPPPLQCVLDWPCEGGCAVGYAWWKAGAGTVGLVEDRYALTCFECDQALGKPLACRAFLHWFDETPREEVRRELLPEVKRELARRAGGAAS